MNWDGYLYVHSLLYSVLLEVTIVYYKWEFIIILEEEDYLFRLITQMKYPNFLQWNIKTGSQT